jgi:broad specificity phosphatase PhoE
MEIVFVRHGESVANREGRLQGQRDYPLTGRGKAQSFATARFLAHTQLSFDACYCSPLSRAKETAAIIGGELELPAPVELPDLMEFDVGQLQGLLYTQVRQKHPEFFQRSPLEYADYERFGGESYDALQERAQRVRRHLEDNHRQPAERQLVVGHGGFGKQLVKHFLCVPLPRLMNLKFGNCTALLVRMSEQLAGYYGQLVWQVPVELMRTWPGMAS